MPCGLLTPPMQALLAPLVARRVVWDLGAGDLTHARLLLDLGAAGVIAVEKEWHKMPRPNDPRLRPLRMYFSSVELRPIEVAFLSWPTNHNLPGLLEILGMAEIVVYLGCNIGGSACGFADLYRELATREPLACEEHRRNTLIAYGREPRTSPMLGEEFAGLTGLWFDTVEDARAAARTFEALVAATDA